MFCSENETPAQPAQPEDEAPAAPAPGEALDQTTALGRVMKTALAHDGLARGIHEVCRCGTAVHGPIADYACCSSCWPQEVTPSGGLMCTEFARARAVDYREIGDLLLVLLQAHGHWTMCASNAHRQPTMIWRSNAVLLRRSRLSCAFLLTIATKPTTRSSSRACALRSLWTWCGSGTPDPDLGGLEPSSLVNSLAALF